MCHVSCRFDQVFWGFRFDTKSCNVSSIRYVHVTRYPHLAMSTFRDTKNGPICQSFSQPFESKRKNITCWVGILFITHQHHPPRQKNANKSKDEAHDFVYRQILAVSVIRSKILLSRCQGYLFRTFLLIFMSCVLVITVITSAFPGDSSIKVTQGHFPFPKKAGVRVGWRLVALSGDDGDDADDASTWQNRLKVVESGKKSWCLKKKLRHVDWFFLVGGAGILKGGTIESSIGSPQALCM